MKREQEQQLEARQTQQQDTLNTKGATAAAMGAADAAGVSGEQQVEEGATQAERTAAEDGRGIAETEQIRQQQEHQDQVAENNVQGLMMQKEGIDMQINSTLQGVKFDERMGTAINAELKGDIQAYQQDCQQLANEVKQGVAQVPGIVRGLARTIETHKRQESGQYTLSKRGDKIEGMVLKQVDRFAKGDAELGKEIYADCKQEIHHEVGALINEENDVPKLKEIREKETKKNLAMDQQAARADKEEETP